jgi:hypothetical protein
LATQAIRNQANRRVLERITHSGGLFYAYSDEPWVLAGAAVHISFIGQDDGSDAQRTLNGLPAGLINPDLTTGLDLTRARRLAENRRIAYYSDVKAGSFEISAEMAQRMLSALNPDGRSNADVLRPWANADDITGRRRGLWIIDFGVDRAITDAELYEAPFEYVKRVVRPERERGRPTIPEWWLHMRPGPSMRVALAPLKRYIVTPAVSKHRLFAWLSADTLADHQLVVVARDDDYFFGVLHSRVHELWSLAVGPRLETRPRYPPQTTFETFPFPDPSDQVRGEIAACAQRLVELRDGWLDPPGATEPEVARRTLTNLYNERPTWLATAHATLDRVVLAAYGWAARAP